MTKTNNSFEGNDERTQRIIKIFALQAIADAMTLMSKIKPLIDAADEKVQKGYNVKVEIIKSLLENLRNSKDLRYRDLKECLRMYNGISQTYLNCELDQVF